MAHAQKCHGQQLLLRKTIRNPTFWWITFDAIIPEGFAVKGFYEITHASVIVLPLDIEL